MIDAHRRFSQLYERATDAFAILLTAEDRPHGDPILRKGVIDP